GNPEGSRPLAGRSRTARPPGPNVHKSMHPGGMLATVRAAPSLHRRGHLPHRIPSRTPGIPAGIHPFVHRFPVVVQGATHRLIAANRTGSHPCPVTHVNHVPHVTYVTCVTCVTCVTFGRGSGNPEGSRPLAGWSRTARPPGPHRQKSTHPEGMLAGVPLSGIGETVSHGLFRQRRLTRQFCRGIGVEK
ncbi:MAG: hypothetical protein RLZZ399_1184, partial [Verrucomicrobiota bacterium]